MVPTLQVGDYILVNKYTYGIRLPVLRDKVLALNEPQRGDVMVFFPPHMNDTYFIKRVVGLPGDTVTYRNKTLFINGEKLAHETLAQLRDVFTPVAEDLVVEMPIDESWLWSGAHHSGTISLGGSGEDIVDSGLRVTGSDNVYVCDASIIQEHSYVNTGLTIAQLAYRLVATIG